jgi:hypothetical protein
MNIEISFEPGSVARKEEKELGYLWILLILLIIICFNFSSTDRQAAGVYSPSDIWAPGALVLSGRETVVFEIDCMVYFRCSLFARVKMICGMKIICFGITI